MNPRPALLASGKPMSTGKMGRLLCRIPGIEPCPAAIEFKLLVRLDSRDCNFTQFTFKILVIANMLGQRKIFLR
jgi:hypothetical protein